MGSRGMEVQNRLLPLSEAPGPSEPSLPLAHAGQGISSPVPSACLGGPRSQGCSPLLPTPLSAVDDHVARQGAPLRFA